jgi:ABC-2 type transport system permease protein
MQMHRVHSGEQTITVTVPRKPAHAGIDPYHLLIDWEMDDNIEEVKAKS